MKRQVAVPEKEEMSRGKSAALWLGSLLLACLFVVSGAMKFSSTWFAAKFVDWGYPGWFRVLIALIEIGAGIVLLVPGLASFSALALGIVMIGAVFTHVTHGEILFALAPLAILAVLTLIGYARFPQAPE
jgi:uncharacterized membrane protein YphA (DoxX/SURF4 family)